MIKSVYTHTMDLDRGLRLHPMGTLLATDDAAGDEFHIRVRRGGQDVMLDGAGVTGYFIRADGVTVPITGTAEGSEAAVTLTDSCYRLPGRFSLVIKAAMDGVRHAVFAAEGAVLRSSTDALVDESGVIPSLDELLAQIAATEAAAESARTAAASAGEAADHARSVAQTVQDALDSGELTGKGLQILGYYPDADALASDVLSPEAGDAYGVGEAEPYDIYVWDALNGAWINNGAIQGPAGPAGPKGDQGEPGLNGVFVRNLLDNSDFRNPVNQRGQSSYTANGYTIDRWMVYDGSITLFDGYVATTGQMYQFIAGLNLDTVYTFAIKNDSGICVVSCAPSGEGVASLGNAKIKLTNSGEYAQVVIEPSEGYATAGAYWAALYEGEYTADTLPEYVPKGYGVELVECMRYYYKIHRDADIVMRYRNTSGAAMTLFENGTIIQFPVEMRIVPTVAIAYDISDGNETTSAPAFASKNSCMLPSLTLDSGAYFDMHYLSASADL